MVFFTPFVGAAAILSGLASAAPMMADSSAAAPGTPATDTWMTTETAKPSWASSAPASVKTPAVGGSSGGSWGGSGSSWESSAAGGSWGSSAAGGSWESSSPSWESSSPSWGYSSSADTWTAAPTSTWAGETITSTAYNTYSTPAYGSGSWGGSESPYDSCVQQCIASYGSMATYTAPTATSTTGSSYGGSSGSGTTHTVIVAPTQGVLRYVPFVVNASVGDTVMFVWNANEHTVTKSSELAICNKTSDAPFASGEQNKSFTFTQKVNDTNSTFFYCGTPGHCEKGMFGIINPPNAAVGSNTSLSSMMPAMVANSSTMSAMWSYTNMMTSNNSAAANWGSNIDMSSMPEWAMSFVAENVMYSRTFLAANPETLDAEGNVNLGAAGSTPLMVPPDITAVMSNSTSNSTGTEAAGSSPSSSTHAAVAAPTTANGARGLASPNMLAGLITLAAIAFAL